MWRYNPSDSYRGDNDDTYVEDDYGDDEEDNGDDEEDNGGDDNDDGDDIKLHLRVNIGAGVVHDGVWISQEELHTWGNYSKCNLFYHSEKIFCQKLEILTRGALRFRASCKAVCDLLFYRNWPNNLLL